MSVLPTHTTFSAPEIKDLAPLFPGYEFEILIATGGMGAVYRAIQKSLERTVAIKILPQEFSKDAAFCAGFEAEAKAMARLNHPNLIGVYDFGEVRGMLYIVMEYVPGKSLFHSAHGIAIDPNEVIRILTGVCSGLAHAHENGILHRDIKPSNILLDLNAQPKIGDFGLARPIERKIQDGEEIFGTPHYTAPEVVQSPHSVDSRADLFSVGVMLHELLTGRLPADDPRPASAICHCDPRFDAIIRKATHPLPSARYASAAEIADDLQAIAATAGPRVLRTAAAVPSAAHPARRPVRPLASTSSSSNSPAIIMMVVAAIVVLFIIIMVASRQPDAATTSPPPPAPKPIVTPVPASPRGQPERKPEPVSNWNQRPDPDPRPQKTPEPFKEPEPEPEPEPDDSPSPVITGTTPPEDPPEEPVRRVFNTEDFLLRAKTIMQERATPLIATRDEQLVKNLADFERVLRRLVRRIDSRDERDRAENRLENFLDECRAAGSRVPEKMPDAFGDENDIADAHRDAITKQKSIDAALVMEISKLSPIYILGLDKQVERLDPSHDEDAIDAIKKEIDETRTVADHFPNLILGIKPDSDEDEDTDDD